jgi:hypothetical protein
VLAIDLPSHARYRATHRQLLSNAVLPSCQPGATLSVSVDRNDPTLLTIG